MEQKILHDWKTEAGYRAIALYRKISDLSSFSYYFVEIPKDHPLYGKSTHNDNDLDYYGDAFPIETDGWWIGYEIHVADDFKILAENLAKELKELDAERHVQDIYKTALTITSIVILVIVSVLLVILKFS